ncbi:MAG TPA: hypothetical protein VGQ71_14405 [Terriglobales bacterium]|jgi:hypothetical protein|nr:hypothetical protein [Terriglobales bacterium]
MDTKACQVPVPAESSVAPLARVIWSRWSRCQSSFDLLLAPRHPGVFALAEEIVAEDGSPQFGSKRRLAMFGVWPAADLAGAIAGLFTTSLRERLQSGRVFVRYAVIPDLTKRDAVWADLRDWLLTDTPGVSDSTRVAADFAEIQAPDPGLLITGARNG